MSTPAASVDRYEVTLNTPRGPVTTSLEVPVQLVPITSIVPLARQLGACAAEEEVRASTQQGATISCKDGCAACCRMMIPLSPPEAFALREHVQSLPEADQARFTKRLEEAKAALGQAGLLNPLTELAYSSTLRSDEELDSLNRAYYALKLPCPFLEQEHCGIYAHRPSACRELLVTSPANLCEDFADKPVEALPVSIRVSTVLGMLWSDVTGTVPRLIPLPLALGWAERHEAEQRQTWKAGELLDQVLDKVWRLLSQAMNMGQEARGKGR